MRIGVNLRQFVANRIGGMENYLRNILPGLSHHSLTIWVLEDQKGTIAELVPGAELIGITHDDGPAVIARSLKENPPDVYFCPLLVLEPLVPPCPSAVLIPDLQHEYYPEFFSEEILAWRRANYAASARNADCVLTISRHAKETLVEKLEVDSGKVEVVCLDVDEEFRRPTGPDAHSEFVKLQLPENFVYFPANYWPHKNHRLALAAFAKASIQNGGTLSLVLSGAAETGLDQIRPHIASLGLENQVLVLGHVPRRVQVEIYRRARALYFPTLFEGFGIPVLEAFHTGIPVLTSAGGSCEEIAGGAALLVDPADEDAIAAGLGRLVADDSLREELISRGRRQAEAFSWAESVQKTEEALRRIANAKETKARRIQVEQWPAIGIVTPTFRMGRFLEETVQSVLGQKYPHVEYVVMDGGSRDETVQILNKYEGRIRWSSEADRGQGHAINKGFRELTGPIFGYLNADDTYLPNAFEAVAKAFRRRPDAGLIYGEGWHVSESGQNLEPYKTQAFDHELLNSRCFICQPAAFVSRKAFETVGMIDENLHFALDYDLWIRIGREFHAYKLDDYLATSRMYGANKTLSARRKVYEEIFEIARRHYKYVPHEWVQGYCCHLLDGRDQFFARSRPSAASHLLSLVKGMMLNPGRRKRYFADWKQGCGIGSDFSGRWDDGWISESYRSRREIGAADTLVRVAGRHSAPILPLKLRLQLDGCELDARTLTATGPFTLEAPVPPTSRGKQCEFVIHADRTWRPMRGGDYRRLSCIIDQVEFDSEKAVD